jgi:NitT/TauT family transport system substrate-binding protein
MLLVGLLAMTACSDANTTAKSAGGPIPIRIAVSPPSGQGAVPFVIRKFGLDRKYGFRIEQVDFASPGQQFLLARSDAADVFPGNFVEVLRQRKAGVGIRSFRAFQSYNNQLIVPAASPIRSFADLEGRRFGQFGTTTVDWLILRAAGKRAHGIDLEKDATVVGGAPPLLNQMLTRGSIDAAVQFSSVALPPLASGKVRLIGDIPGLIAEAGFDPNAYYLLWNVSEKWLDRHPAPDTLRKLDAMFAEAYAILARDDAIWEDIGRQVGVKPELIARYREDNRSFENPPYRPDLIAPTQRLLDAIVATTGAATVGVTKVDPAAYAFPAAEPAAKP